MQGSDWKNIKDNVQQNSSQKKTTQKIEPVDVWGGSARETHIEGRDVPISSPRVMSKPAPNIVLDTYEPFSLSQYRGRWVILFFYPNNFDARDEIITLNTHLPKFTNLNTVLVGFAGVNEFHQQGFSIKNGINLPLLPDPDGKIAELYGVTFLNSTHTRTWFLIDPIGMVVNTANTISWENIFPVLQQHVRDTEKLFSEAREDISKLIHEKKCCLPLLRLVWEWWQPEDDKIHVARNFLFQLKEKYFEISGPDFFQISGNIAISELGGPKIPFRYGRSPIVQDSTGAIVQPRDSFGARFDEKDMVALAYVEALVHGQTEHPEKFSNEYYASILETEHSYIPKDGEDSTSSSTGLFPSGPQLLHNDSFREYVEKYAQSQEEFF